MFQPLIHSYPHTVYPDTRPLSSADPSAQQVTLHHAPISTAPGLNLFHVAYTFPDGYVRELSPGLTSRLIVALPDGMVRLKDSPVCRLDPTRFPVDVPALFAAGTGVMRIDVRIWWSPPTDRDSVDPSKAVCISSVRHVIPFTAKASAGHEPVVLARDLSSFPRLPRPPRT